MLETSQTVRFLMEADGAGTIDETLEGNNHLEVEIPVENPGDGSGNGNRGGMIVISSLLLVLISLAAFQLGPKSLKKDFERRK